MLSLRSRLLRSAFAQVSHFAVKSPLAKPLPKRAVSSAGGLKGNGAVGIRREDKSRWERRAPLTPSHVDKLIREGVKVIVQPSTLRIFNDYEYEQAGATLREDLSEASLILAVKEVPIHKLIPQRTYMFFSHTIKAQPYNMPLLDAILENNIRLIDYEKIVNDNGQRLVRFGRYAGYAGMIDFLHGLGNRMLAMGYSSPFLHIGYTHMYSELENARAAVRSIGNAVKQGALPRALGPLVFTFTGTGSVAQGALDIFELLPHTWVNIADLPKLIEDKNYDHRTLYAVRATTSEIVARIDGTPGPVDKQHYYAHPEMYRSTFAERVAPYTTVLVNCLYWDQRFPRLLTIPQAEQLARRRRFRLIGLADLSADLNGSVEFMRRSTNIDFPFYVYDVERHVASDNIATGKGVLISSVDNLPSEIPYEASQYFGDSLLPFVKALAFSDASIPFEQQTDLPKPIQTAVITSHGQLTPAFQYITEFRRRNEREKQAVSARHRVLVLGSGMVAGPLVKYLTDQSSVHVTVASDDIAGAEQLCQDRLRAVATEVNVADEKQLRSLVRSHDVIVSMVPPKMHIHVAHACIAEKRHLVTTSYVSPEMAALNDDARAAGITILNEVGLDPGIDHLLAMRAITEATQRGAILKSFVSHCGGLPAPECSDNPFGYKFSWSPRGALAAGALNGARYLEAGRVVEIQPGTVFDAAQRTIFTPGYRCEVLPNRDSLHYAELYGTGDAQTFFRGTLRYEGFGMLMSCIQKMGYLSDAPSPLFAPGAGGTSVTWRDVTASLLPDFAGYDVEGATMRMLNIADTDQVCGGACEARIDSVLCSLHMLSAQCDGMFSACDARGSGRRDFTTHRLGLFSSTPVPTNVATPLDALCSLMLSKMVFAQGERDLVLMKHEFLFSESDGTETRHVSSLIVYGDEQGSAMSKTVGTPAAIACKLLLDEHIVRRGVLTPTTPDIYYPMLSMLKAAGITAKETSENLSLT